MPPQLRAPANPLDFIGSMSGNMPWLTDLVGLPNGVQTIPEYMHQVATAMPDVVSPIYEEVIAGQRGDLDRARRENRGRALMEMGIAMMGAQTPNFLAALGQGGAAGLAARDRAQEQERALQGGINQSMLAQATGLNQRNAIIHGAAADYRGQDRQAVSAAAGLAADMAGRGADIRLQQDRMAQDDRNAAADRAIEQQSINVRLAEMAWERENEGRQNAVQQQQFRHNLMAQTATALAEDYISAINRDMMSPEQYQEAVDAARARAFRDATSIVYGSTSSGSGGRGRPASPPTIRWTEDGQLIPGQ